jgi:predicted kinase
MNGQVVVLSGPPGAGKSTIAGLLARHFELAVELHGDDFWGCIKRGWIAPWLAASRRQNEVVMDVVATAAAGYAAGGYQVICDALVGPWFLGPFRAAAAARGVPLHYAVLRPDAATALQRAAGRAGPRALTDPGPVALLHAQFAELGELESHVADSTALSVPDTVRAVLAGLASGRFLLPAGSADPAVTRNGPGS